MKIFFSCALFCCGRLLQYIFEKSSRCSCPAFISPIPKVFALSGYFLNLLSALYPITFLYLGIQSNLLFLIPKIFLCSGYSYFIFLLYTQRLSLLWVFLLHLLLYTQRFFFLWVLLMHFSSLYPKMFLSLGTLNAFCFSIPKDFSFSGYSYCICFSIPKGYLFHGYISDFCIRYTQTSIFI